MLATSLPIAQWLERPTGVWKVMGTIPVGDSDFLFVPRSRHVDYSIFSLTKMITSKTNVFTAKQLKKYGLIANGLGGTMNFSSPNNNLIELQLQAFCTFTKAHKR